MPAWGLKLDIWDQKTVVGGRSALCRVFISTRGYSAPAAPSHPTETIKKVSRRCHMSSAGHDSCPHCPVPLRACPAAPGEASRATPTVLSGPTTLAPRFHNRNGGPTHKAHPLHSHLPPSPLTLSLIVHSCPWRHRLLIFPLFSGLRRGEPGGPARAHLPVRVLPWHMVPSSRKA